LAQAHLMGDESLRKLYDFYGCLARCNALVKEERRALQIAKREAASLPPTVREAASPRPSMTAGAGLLVIPGDRTPLPAEKSLPWGSPASSAASPKTLPPLDFSCASVMLASAPLDLSEPAVTYLTQQVPAAPAPAPGVPSEPLAEAEQEEPAREEPPAKRRRTEGADIRDYFSRMGILTGKGQRGKPICAT